MDKIINWFKRHWQERIFKISTACGLALAFMELFHRTELNALLINPIIIGAVCTLLIGIKK